jgi:hypothetical protein
LDSGIWKQSVVIERSRFVQTIEQRRLQHHKLAANVSLRTTPALREFTPQFTLTVRTTNIKERL